MAEAQRKSEKPVDDAEEIVVEPEEIVVEEAATGEAPTATATLTDEKAESPFGGERVVYVTAPLPPKARSNRIVGVLLALAGAVGFAVIYALVGAGLIALTPGVLTFSRFIMDAIFWIPVLFFTLGFVLVVALLNRAAWWIHVLGSLLVALITYFGSIGMLVVVTAIAGQALVFTDIALSPYVIAATIVAREVSIWVGLLISRRGVRLTASNKAEREAFDAEQAEKKNGGSGAAAASA